MISVSNLLDKVSDFDSLTQREQVKLLSYFYCISNNIEEFTSSQIKKCFEVQNLSMPANITHELNKLASQKPQVLNKKDNTYSFHRTARKELSTFYLKSTESDQSAIPEQDKNEIELFNCYIRVGDNKQIIPTVSRSDIDKMFQAIRAGNDKVLINGRYVEINNFDSFKIYDFSFQKGIASKGEAKHQMELEKNILGVSWSISVFKRFGVDVTDKFEIPETNVPQEKNGYDYFVDKNRMEELRKISDPNFDLTRLVRKCEELNNNFASSSFFSTALLVRSIIDHVPPIFGKSNFSCKLP